MSLKKDKQKVLGETFDDDRIRGFLSIDAPAGVDADFHLLEKAYRGMKADNFNTFLDMFIAAGHNINASNVQGENLLALVSKHSQGAEYVQSLTAHGAA